MAPIISETRPAMSRIPSAAASPIRPVEDTRQWAAATTTAPVEDSQRWAAVKKMRLVEITQPWLAVYKTAPLPRARRLAVALATSPGVPVQRFPADSIAPHTEITVL